MDSFHPSGGIQSDGLNSIEEIDSPVAICPYCNKVLYVCKMLDNYDSYGKKVKDFENLIIETILANTIHKAEWQAQSEEYALRKFYHHVVVTESLSILHLINKTCYLYSKFWFHNILRLLKIMPLPKNEGDLLFRAELYRNIEQYEEAQKILTIKRRWESLYFRNQQVEKCNQTDWKPYILEYG